MLDLDMWLICSGLCKRGDTWSGLEISRCTNTDCPIHSYMLEDSSGIPSWEEIEERYKQQCAKIEQIYEQLRDDYEAKGWTCRSIRL